MLEAVADLCGERNTHQLVVVQGGDIILERCWRGSTLDTAMDIASAQKSVTSAVVGALCGRGVLDLDAPVSTWLGDGWSRATVEQEHEILLRHLLSMTSGLYDGFEREAAPGTVWYYNNNAYHQTRKVIEHATGRTCQAVYGELVFEPLGMTTAEWVERPGMNDVNGWNIAGLRMSARDLARFGVAMLDDLDGWFSRASAPSQSLNPAYGLLWWRLGASHGIVPGSGPEPDPRKVFGGRLVDGPLAPSAPPDTVAALGFADQKLYVAPSRGLVVARLGEAAHGLDAAASRFDEELWSVLAGATGGEEAPEHGMGRAGR